MEVKEPIEEFIKFNYPNESEVYCGDALKYLEKFPEKKFDLIITSPPYNVGKSYEVKETIERYLKSQEEIIKELVKVLSDRGSICWQVGNYVEKGEVFPLDIYYYNIFKKFDLKLRNRIIWYFGHGLHASKRFSGRYETILWFTKTDDYIFNLDDVRVPAKYPSDIWEIVAKDWEKELWDIPNVKSNHPEKTEHPCQFPVELVERCVLALTNEDSWILDPFAGVGSSLIAAVKNNRNAIGIDKEEKYCKVSKQRIQQLKEGKLKLRPITKPIHKPSPNDKVAKVPAEWLSLEL